MNSAAAQTASVLLLLVAAIASVLANHWPDVEGTYLSMLRFMTKWIRSKLYILCQPQKLLFQIQINCFPRVDFPKQFGKLESRLGFGKRDCSVRFYVRREILHTGKVLERWFHYSIKIQIQKENLTTPLESNSATTVVRTYCAQMALSRWGPGCLDAWSSCLALGVRYVSLGATPLPHPSTSLPLVLPPQLPSETVGGRYVALQ